MDRKRKASLSLCAACWFAASGIFGDDVFLGMTPASDPVDTNQSVREYSRSLNVHQLDEVLSPDGKAHGEQIQPAISGIDFATPGSSSPGFDATLVPDMYYGTPPVSRKPLEEDDDKSTSGWGWLADDLLEARRARETEAKEDAEPGSNRLTDSENDESFTPGVERDGGVQSYFINTEYHFKSDQDREASEEDPLPLLGKNANPDAMMNGTDMYQEDHEMDEYSGRSAIKAWDSSENTFGNQSAWGSDLVFGSQRSSDMRIEKIQDGVKNVSETARVEPVLQRPENSVGQQKPFRPERAGGQSAATFRPSGSTMGIFSPGDVSSRGGYGGAGSSSFGMTGSGASRLSYGRFDTLGPGAAMTGVQAPGSFGRVGSEAGSKSQLISPSSGAMGTEYRQKPSSVLAW